MSPARQADSLEDPTRDLLERCARGESQALHELYELISPLLFATN